MVNEGWCDSRNITVLQRFCSPEVEFLAIKCRPHFLVREFTSVVVVAVYIPPEACTGTALAVLYEALNSYQARDPTAALAVAGDFNKANLTCINTLTVLPEDRGRWITVILRLKADTGPSLSLLWGKVTMLLFSSGHRM